jgi:hypothetical protein
MLNDTAPIEGYLSCEGWWEETTEGALQFPLHAESLFFLDANDTKVGLM